MKTQLLMLRHGEPEIRNCLLGRTNPLLTDKGWQQLQIASSKLKDITLVITSPLLRCVKFATDFSNSNNIELICDDLWQECNFGEWDGIDYSILKQQQPQKLASFLDNPAVHTPPNGESLLDFNDRVKSALTKLIENYKGHKILLVTHGGVIRSLIGDCLKLNTSSDTELINSPFQQLGIEYGSLSQINYYQDEFIYSQMIYMNQLPSDESCNQHE